MVQTKQDLRDNYIKNRTNNSISYTEWLEEKLIMIRQQITKYENIIKRKCDLDDGK